MNKKLLILFISTIVSNYVLLAQIPPSQLSSKIAGRMKDSLALTEAQRAQVLNVNMSLENLKMTVRSQAASGDIGIQLQAIENTRDSLYRNVLTADQFLLYRKKKNRLVNNN